MRQSHGQNKTRWASSVVALKSHPGRPERDVACCAGCPVLEETVGRSSAWGWTREDDVLLLVNSTHPNRVLSSEANRGKMGGRVVDDYDLARKLGQTKAFWGGSFERAADRADRQGSPSYPRVRASIWAEMAQTEQVPGEARATTWTDTGAIMSGEDEVLRLLGRWSRPRTGRRSGQLADLGQAHCRARLVTACK